MGMALGSGDGCSLTLRRKARLPMAGLWPRGQSLNQGLAGGDPARVQVLEGLLAAALPTKDSRQEGWGGEWSC